MLRNNFNKILILHSALFLLPVFSVVAQNFKTNFASTQAAYNTLDKFYCEVGISIYDNYSSKNPEEKIASVIKKQKNNFWYSMGKTIMVVNDKCILYINNDAKQIVYTIRDKKREIEVPNQNAAAMIDSIVKKSDSVIFEGIKNNCFQYAIYASRAAIIKTELSIGQDDFLIKRICYYYDEKKYPTSNKVIIEYSKINTTIDFSDAEFSEKKYITYSNRGLKPLPPYVGYSATIVDQNDIK